MYAHIMNFLLFLSMADIVGKKRTSNLNSVPLTKRIDRHLNQILNSFILISEL